MGNDKIKRKFIWQLDKLQSAHNKIAANYQKNLCRAHSWDAFSNSKDHKRFCYRAGRLIQFDRDSWSNILRVHSDVSRFWRVSRRRDKFQGGQSKIVAFFSMARLVQLKSFRLEEVEQLLWFCSMVDGWWIFEPGSDFFELRSEEAEDAFDRRDSVRLFQWWNCEAPHILRALVPLWSWHRSKPVPQHLSCHWLSHPWFRPPPQTLRCP